MMLFQMLARIFNFLPEFITDFMLRFDTGCHKAPRDQTSTFTFEHDAANLSENS
jgi:hypothetical protein